jgi:hypothetical protein
MYPGVKPAEEATNEACDTNITSFMKPKQNWTKEGLLEHIIELVVAEDKVCHFALA